MNMMRMSIVLSMLLALGVQADPALAVPKAGQSSEKKVMAIEVAFAKVTFFLESAFDAMAAVKDDASLATSGAKLEHLAKVMLALEPQIDVNVKPTDAQMRFVAEQFVHMGDKVQKKMRAMAEFKLSEELRVARDEQFTQFLAKVEPVKKKTDALLPPQKLSKFVKAIKAEQAAKAAKAKPGEPGEPGEAGEAGEIKE